MHVPKKLITGATILAAVGGPSAAIACQPGNSGADTNAPAAAAPVAAPASSSSQTTSSQTASSTSNAAGDQYTQTVPTAGGGQYVGDQYGRWTRHHHRRHHHRRHHHRHFPVKGGSAAGSQYTETVPTAGGGVPVS